MDHYESREISGVPCIVLNPQTEPLGQIMLYHGWGSTNESYGFFASLIVNWGYTVIIPELPWHGARGSLDYADAEVMQAYFWKVVMQGVQEAEGIAKELAREDHSPITLIGHSTGGFVAAGAFAAQEQIHAAAVINGSCAWVRFEELYRAQSGLPPMEAGEKAALQQHDPYSNLQAFMEKPTLLLHCQEDTSVPIDSQTYFLDEITKLAPQAGQVQFHTFPRVNHQITLGMLQKIKAFLDSIRSTN